MRHYQIREVPDESRVVIEFWTDADARPVAFADYPDAQAALEVHDDLAWHVVSEEEREAEEIGGDVLYLAEVTD